jgi:hypothetical protein
MESVHPRVEGEVEGEVGMKRVLVLLGLAALLTFAAFVVIVLVERARGESAATVASYEIFGR